jgi:hypothetical protein
MSTACDNVVVCKEASQRLEQWFEGYDFKYVVKQKYVKEGGSGKAVKLDFKKDSVMGYAIFKMAAGKNNEKADNLFREGIVGLQINAAADIFPAFIRTLGLYKQSATGKYSIDNVKFKKYNKVPTIATACKMSDKEAILVEYVDGQPITNLYRRPDFSHELLPVLFQIYYPLLMLGSTYTHYDLHTGNVMLSRPFKNGCILFEYTMPTGEIISFKSAYIAKIIDYGRNYVESLHGSLEEIKTKPECNTKRCGHFGNKCGFRNYQNPKHPGLGFRMPNVSHDLRLLNYAVMDLKEEKKWNGPDVEFDNGEGEFSTVEIKESGLNNNKINNVMDAGVVLAMMVHNNFKAFEGVPVLGTLRCNGLQPWSFQMVRSASGSGTSSGVGGRRGQRRSRIFKTKKTSRLVHKAKFPAFRRTRNRDAGYYL